MKFFGSATMSVKGQVVIPIEARSALGLEENEKLLVMSAPFENGIVLIKADSLNDMMQGFQQKLLEMQQSVQNDNQ